jgi:hypothetical protein
MYMVSSNTDYWRAGCFMYGKVNMVLFIKDLYSEVEVQRSEVKGKCIGLKKKEGKTAESCPMPTFVKQAITLLSQKKRNLLASQRPYS